MSFEYNGVVYRDLEPQVRYDAEQVQLLKQADVTINENLQTINTEINGKLTKPTNPSAESAVTMLADGTVGTKLLSEIGGGKLYRHNISITIQQGNIYLFLDDTNSAKYNITTLAAQYRDLFIPAAISAGAPPVPAILQFITSLLQVFYGSNSEISVNIPNGISGMSDTVTEL